MRAKVRGIRIAPRKVRLVVDMIRGRNVDEALSLLQFTHKSSSKPLAKLVKSAVANADKESGVNVDRLFVKAIWADGGPTIKRFMQRAMGRATPIRHRTTEVTVELGER